MSATVRMFFSVDMLILKFENDIWLLHSHIMTKGPVTLYTHTCIFLNTTLSTTRLHINRGD